VPTEALTLRGRLAWAHDFNIDRSISAALQTEEQGTKVSSRAAISSRGVRR
jgi:uncharacterized protein with beta-barrel porin domain